MADVAWRSLLAPLDVSAAATAVLVLQLVPAPLAGAVLQCLAKAWHSQELSMPSSENIVWKCAQYLPMIARGPRTAAPLLASLTALQKDCPQLPVVRIASSRSICLCGAELKAKKPVDGAIQFQTIAQHLQPAPIGTKCTPWLADSCGLILWSCNVVLANVAS